MSRLNPSGGDFSILQNVQTDSGSHPDCYSMATEFLFLQECGRSVKLTIRLHLAPRLITSGATALLLICLHGVDRDVTFICLYTDGAFWGWYQLLGTYYAECKKIKELFQT